MSRHEGYGVPPLRCQLPERLRLCVIADGNTRHGGHHGGKRATIALAEHCAARGDIELLVVCVLSYENIAKRPEAFFLRLEQLFLELGVDIVAEGVFVRAAVRCRIYGALGLLRARGGAAARLAGLLEAITHLTAQVATPRLELVFAVGYPSTLAEEFDLHTVVRTGMEEEGVLRTSGIDVSPSVLCYATSILYPDFGSDHFDAALATARRGFAPTFASGYSVAFIAELLAVVEATDFGPPWRLTLPIAAPVDEVTALLDRLQAEGLADRAAIGVEYAWSASQPPRRYGPPWETARELVLVAPAARAAITRALAPTALIAMGQEGGTFVLPHEPAVWHANVFGAACSAAGVVEAVCRWLRFAEAHPALRGADRVAASVATPPEPVSAPWPPGVASRLRWLDAHPETSIDDLVALAPIDDPREALADAGAAMMLHAARVRGLLPTRPELLRAFLNYQRTATIMCHRVPRETDPAGERWLEVGLHAASLMSAVALSDEEIFDRPTPTLSAEERKAWLSEVAGYLGAVVHGHEAPRPHGPAAAQIDAIAALWRETLDRFQAHAHPAILAGWQGALAALYRSNIDEIDPDVADNPLLLDLSMSGHPRRAAVQAIEARYATRAPAPVAARIRHLLAAVASTPERLPMIVRELTVWVFLGHTAPSIAAGILFRHLALLWPARRVTLEMAAALDQAATLIDYRFRLANDLSSLRSATGLDRDGKPNAWTVLVPAALRGVDAARATIDANALCRRLEAWIVTELGQELAELERVWPSLARFVRRGLHVGALVYQRGHYATAASAFMRQVFERVEET